MDQLVHCGSLEWFPQLQHLALVGHLLSATDCLHAIESSGLWPGTHQPCQGIEESRQGVRGKGGEGGLGFAEEGPEVGQGSKRSVKACQHPQQHAPVYTLGM